MIRFLATVAERDYDMTTKVYLKKIPWNVVRTDSEPLKIERFGRFKNTNVSNKTWKAWQTWFATVRFAFNKFLTYCRHDRRLELVFGSTTSLGHTYRRSGNGNSDETIVERETERPWTGTGIRYLSVRFLLK